MARPGKTFHVSRSLMGIFKRDVTETEKSSMLRVLTASRGTDLNVFDGFLKAQPTRQVCNLLYESFTTVRKTDRKLSQIVLDGEVSFQFSICLKFTFVCNV